MRTISQTFTGQLPVAMAGKMLRILSATAPVDVRLYSEVGLSEATGMQDGYYCKPHGGFTRFDLIASGTVTVKVLVSDEDGGVDAVAIMGQVTTVPVRGSVVINRDPCLVGTSQVQIITADITRKEARIYNAGSDFIYIGASGITTENGAVKIGPGQMWIEDTGAAAGWYGISPTAGQYLRIQEVF